MTATSEPEREPASPVPLQPPPEATGAWRIFGAVSHRSFMVLNRLFMIPCLRAGLGPWIGNPATGYVLLLRVVGRRSGITREIPLSYLIQGGSAWVLAGYGPATQWYRNVLAQPRVEVCLPGRTIVARAEEVLDREIRRGVVPRLARAAGVPGFLVGCNPWTAGEATILRKLDWVPLVRLRPVDGALAAGPDDPGGHAWVWRQAAVAWAMRKAIGAVRRARPGGGTIRA